MSTTHFPAVGHVYEVNFGSWVHHLHFESETVMTLTIAEGPAEMLLRKPVAEVFEAFRNPEITTMFWFTKSSGRLEAGKQVTWSWEMYNASSQVTVKDVEQNKRILIEWSGYGSPTTVEWIFTSYGNDATFVRITNSGFSGYSGL